MDARAGANAGERLVALDDADYPQSLRHVFAPPRVLHVRGVLAIRPASLSRPAVAIVGARDATAYGLGVARRLGRDLAEAGIVVVSGLALGIDGAAHRGALEGGGTTIAVAGCGTDVVYPRQHRALREEILATGAVVGELEPGTPPRRENFPRRNRIISGLALAVVVVEAGLKSGSLSTAAHAVEQGREVLAVPGRIDAPRSAGPHALLKRGARLVEGVDDVLAELPPGVACPTHTGPEQPNLEPGLAALLRAVAGGPATVDELARELDRNIPELLENLLALELRGLLLRGPGGRYAVAGGAASSGTAHAGRGVDSPPDER